MCNCFGLWAHREVIQRMIEISVGPSNVVDICFVEFFVEFENSLTCCKKKYYLIIGHFFFKAQC